jgi:hypothetical protein
VTEWERGKTQGDIDNARFVEPYLTEEKLKSAIQVLERRAQRDHGASFLLVVGHALPHPGIGLLSFCESMARHRRAGRWVR